MKLKYLASWNETRRQHAKEYKEHFADTGAIRTPIQAAYAKHIYHVYAIRTPRRDDLIPSLGERGISCGIHYPVPLHLQKAYSFMGLENGGYPVAEKCCQEFVSLPMFPELKEEQIEYVVHAIKELV